MLPPLLFGIRQAGFQIAEPPPSQRCQCVAVEQAGRAAFEQGRLGPQTTAMIFVEDTGPGIPEDKLEKIFDRFYTDRPKGSAFGKNSGLGLSIVQQIATTHMGRVWAENRREGGARFIVELPAI